MLRPVPDIAKVAFAVNPANLSSFGSDDLVSCRYQPVEATGTTPSSIARWPRVKSSRSSRAQRGTGGRSGGDPPSRRARVRRGSDVCRRPGALLWLPAEPVRIQQAADLARGQKLLKAVDYSKSTDFEWATVEREFEAPEITAGGSQGWAWWELDQIDPARGGASRARVDAFRLMAVFLAHWDNKAENQRLVCLGRAGWSTVPGAVRDDSGYRRDVRASQGRPRRLAISADLE